MDKVGIKSCADEIVEELAKEFQAKCDFALNKVNLLADHELRVVVERPEESDEKCDEEEEEERELAEDQQNI